MYHSWYNLTENGIIMSAPLAHGGDSQSSGGGSLTYESITSGFYTPETMAITITDTFKENNINITVDTRTSLGVMNILNPKNKYTFTLSANLKALFGVVSQV